MVNALTREYLEVPLAADSRLVYNVQMLGKRFAHYEIIGPLGKGGMGEVYRARDTKLGRDVAIKVLPENMSGDRERLARFDREARTLATLQHPNIASIYGFETAGNVRCLVMELVGGEDLSDRLQRGAIPAGDAVGLAVQLAEGLAAAHAVGIVHRDLKPANIKISSEGKLKILDFGLARAYADEHESESDPANSPTITAMTQAGVILGTAAYMSPEQARGKRVDYRADIWAFGVVLFEMLTGRRLFEGETVSDTLAGVLRADVPWNQLPKDTPPTVRRLLERCLDRDRSRRLQSIAEARIALEDLKAGRGDESAPEAAIKSVPSVGRERMAWIVTVVVFAAIAAMAVLRHTAPQQPLVQSTLLPPEGWDFAPAAPFAVSPDGRQVAFVAIARPGNEDATAGSAGIWIRDLASPEPRQLTSTDGEGYPFWSPDGRWLGFFANGKLNKIEARGGPIVPLCAAADGRGGSWNKDGTIIFQKAWSEALMKVPAGGGTAEPVTTLNKDRFEVAHRWPHFLPDGRHFLFYVVSTTNTTTSEHSGIYIGSLDSHETRFLLKSESRALYAQGYLLYRVGSTLMAHPFDVSSLEFTGDPTPVATDIPGGAISWGGAQFGVSEAGVLVHMRGSGATRSVLNWRDRDGKLLSTVGDLSNYWDPALSHDGTRLAVSVGQDAGDIWIYDLKRDTRTRFTFDPADDAEPLWSPDDSRLVFISARKAPGEIYVRPTSGQVDAELLYTANTNIVLHDWSSDGRLIFFSRLGLGDDGWDVWTLDMETYEAKPYLSGRFAQAEAHLSPDRKWLAFTSDESGNEAVYVQSFADAAGRWMVSSDAGAQASSSPMWRGDSRELYFLKGNVMMAVTIKGDGNFSSGAPRSLFNVLLKSSTKESYAVSKDGQRFLTNELKHADRSKIGARLIQNWTAILAR